MKSTLKILALLIALAIPTQAKAEYYVGDDYPGFHTKLVFTSDLRDNATWGQPGMIWQICDWNLYNDEYGNQYRDVSDYIEVTLNQNVTIAGPIYIPDNKTLCIHTNGKKITPLKTTQSEWETSVAGGTGISTITNSASYYTQFVQITSFDVTVDESPYTITPSKDVWAYQYVPHCSFFFFF